MRPKIAIIGAGLAGLTLAQALQSVAAVTVFEKSRGVGGRMSTRYAAPFYFDHGAQYFTARSPAFLAFLQGLQSQGVVAQWRGQLLQVTAQAQTIVPIPTDATAWWVACPHMNSLCRHLAQGVDVRLETEIAPLSARADGQWLLMDRQQRPLGNFDWVLVTAPVPQAQNLLDTNYGVNCDLAHRPMVPCFTLMLGLNEPWPHPWQLARIEVSEPMARAKHAIRWIAHNSSKPARDPALTSLVIQTDHHWSASQLNTPSEQVTQELLAAAQPLLQLSASTFAYQALHRWKYARVKSTPDAGSEPYEVDLTQQWAVTGDGYTGSRVESVWLGAHALAQRLLTLVS